MSSEEASDQEGVSIHTRSGRVVGGEELVGSQIPDLGLLRVPRDRYIHLAVHACGDHVSTRIVNTHRGNSSLVT